MAFTATLSLALVSTVASVVGFSSPTFISGSVRPSSVRMMAEKSKALPMLEQPKALDGTMIGDVGFDPLGLSDLKINDTPLLGKNGLLWMREAELQHGRLCMLATLGYIAVDLGLRFPGEQFQGISSLAAHNAMVSAGPMKLLLFVVSCLEIVKLPALAEMMLEDSGRQPGDFAFDPLNFGGSEKLRLNELKNGRLAMLAFSGLVTQDVLRSCGSEGGFAKLCSEAGGATHFPYF